MAINCIIVEDEPLARERLQEFVIRVPLLHLTASFDNGRDALTHLTTNPVDLIFLDINMGTFSGIQLLESASITAQVIITTAYTDYALKGFDLEVTDYLLKPFTVERFQQAIDRVVSFLKPEPPVPEPFLLIKSANSLEKIWLQDILYIEGMRDYRRIHTTTKKIMTLKTFTDLALEIPPSFICRIHKSYMVALQHIGTIEKDAVWIGKIKLPVSETYKKKFVEQVKASRYF